MGGDARRKVVVAGMTLLGLAALAVPAALVELREAGPVALAPDVVEELRESDDPFHRLHEGTIATLAVAGRALREGRRTDAVRALDTARRAAEVGAAAAPDSPFPLALDEVRAARRNLHLGRPADAVLAVTAAIDRLHVHVHGEPRPPDALGRYRGATVLDAQGNRIGEVEAVGPEAVTLALDGLRDVAGLLDLRGGERTTVAPDALLYGPARAIGATLVVLPVLRKAPEA